MPTLVTLNNLFLTLILPLKISIARVLLSLSVIMVGVHALTCDKQKRLLELHVILLLLLFLQIYQLIKKKQREKQSEEALRSFPHYNVILMRCIQR